MAYVNGVQMIRDRDVLAEPPQTVTIPKKGRVTWDNFALAYVGHDQNNEGQTFLSGNDGNPVYIIDWTLEFSDKVRIRMKRADNDHVIAETQCNPESGVYAIGFVNNYEESEGGYKLAFGSVRVMDYDEDEDKVKPVNHTKYYFGMTSGNSVYIENKSDEESITVKYSYDGLLINAQLYFTAEEEANIEKTFTNSSNDNPNPAKSTDTSSLDPRGGGGTETNRSDTILPPDNTAELNNYSGVSAGFISLYSATPSQLKSLASYLWTSDFVDVIKKMFGDPMDVIIGLTQLPFSVPTGMATSVKAGFIDTGIIMPRVAQQYIDFNMGSISYGSYWGNALDFDPYTKVQIYLPFIGFRTLNTNDVINSTVSLKYRVDCLTGSVTAWVTSGPFVKYEFSGQCGASIPITSQNYNNVINTAINVVTTVGTGIVGGVATGGLGTMASMATVNGISNVASGIASGGMKPTVQRSGGMGGASSLMGMRTPYLVFQRPKTSLPGNYNNLYGYACNKYLKLGNCRGFTQVEHMHLQVQGATDDEMKEIENILHKGVFI
jgi:hypothetical protein